MMSNVEPAGDPPAPPPPEPAAHSADLPAFDTQNILWHFGGLSAVVAGVVVVGEVHHSARGFWMLLVSLAFLAAFVVGAAALLRTDRRVPGGILAAAAVSFVPLAGEGFERLIGVWGQAGGTAVYSSAGVTVNAGAVVVDRFDGHEFALAVATAVAGLIVYALVRYAFVFAWIVGATLAAVELLLPVVVSHPNGADRADTLLLAGLAFVGSGLYADLLHARRVAFWWHLAGLAMITGAFVYDTIAHSSPGWIFVLGAGLVALVCAAPLRRATWALFGLLGTWAPIVHYSSTWFGSLGTAFALFVIGLSILAAGLAVERAGDSVAGLLRGRARHA
jgi:hypothetical protein